MSDSYDVVVVGGGAAGLSGAMALGRSRRRVLVVDGGEPRNAPAGQVHNYLGRENIPPAELVRIGRAEVEQYGVDMVDDHVLAVTRAAGDGLGFDVALASDRSVHARRVLVATGLVDEPPAVPGLADRWGRDVLHCPYCHGWEVRDRAIAVLVTSPLSVHQVLLFRQLSDDVVAVVADSARLADADLERFAALGVRVEHGTPLQLVVKDDRLVGLILADGQVLERDAVVVASTPHVRADFLAPVGVSPKPFEMGGQVLGTVIPVEATGATSVPGVYAAGNATDISATVISSAAHGLRVGAMINADLATADTDAAVAVQRDTMFERPAWEQRYGGDGHVWSGRANPQLVAEAAGLPPGRALDVGCGEGGDTVWLAQHGWQVTGVDFAQAALTRTTVHAEQQGVADRVEVRKVDVRTFTPGDETWDLVSSQFMHQPDGSMVEVVRRLAAAVAPGGTLLVVGHHPRDMATGLRHGHYSHLFTPEDLLPALDHEWDVEVSATRPRQAPHPQTGEPMQVYDSVLRARRR